MAQSRRSVVTPFTPSVMAILTLATLASCATVPKRVQRHTDAYTAEIVSGLAREQAAAEALLEAADKALVGGDVALCQRYAEPALVIRQFAELEAYRALWLAGLPYPVNGELPDPKTEQADPAETQTDPPDPADPLLYCEED